MVNKELLDYINGQLAADVGREKITSDLLGEGGWHMGAD